MNAMDGIDELLHIVNSDRYELSKLNTSFIYHYCKTDIVKLILNPNNVTFKMTDITDFEDKLEGRKTVLQHYKKAIDELKREGKLSEEMYKIIQNIELSEFSLYVPGLTDKNTTPSQAKRCEYRTFVSCFSTLKDDLKLIKKFIKRPDNKGYSIEFNLQSVISDCSSIYLNTGFPVELVIAKYESEVIRIIKDSVYKMINNSFLCGSKCRIENILKSILWFLDNLRYRVKSQEYENENEVRIVAKVPLDYDNSRNEITVTKEKEKNVCFISLNRYVFSNLFKSPTITILEEQEMKNSIIAAGYSWLAP